MERSICQEARKKQASHGFLIRNAIAATTHHHHGSTSTSSSGGGIVIISSNNCSTTNRARFEKSWLLEPLREYSKPYLRKSDIPVTNISLEEGELGIMNPVTCACYGGFVSNCYQPPELGLIAFSISNTKNKFTAIGCDTRATINVSGENYFVATGCESQCSTINYIPDGPCSGIGCCQTSIPKGVGYMNILLQSYSNHENVSKFNPCSYAFVVEEGAFNFSKSYLRNFTEEMMQIVLDWTLGNNKTCRDSKRNLESYECGENSDCYDSKNRRGYFCKWRIGYKGNPYLLDGCQDIKECEDPKLNMCEHKNKCVDMPPRNYTCSCPKGYHGDGRTDGIGCIANQFLAIQIAVGFAIGALVVLVSSSWLYWIFKKRKLIVLKEKFFRQNGGLMLKQQLSRLERSTEDLIKILIQKSSSRLPITMMRVELLAKEVLEQFTREFYQRTR
ncbi:unnamed protein product [Camellia sinensis]